MNKDNRNIQEEAIPVKCTKEFIAIRQKIPLPLGGKQEPLQGHLFLHPQDASLPLPAPWLPLMGHGITEDIIGRGQT